MDRRLGKHPLIVGCVASAAQLRRCARQAPADCDWIEVRLDLTGPCGGSWPELGGGRRRQAGEHGEPEGGRGNFT